ncbi:MAG: hypothetical protein J6F30_06940 [Cellulosilyticum sp.]|nr:hypothetical protein [Cellulosilyticum sp.]
MNHFDQPEDLPLGLMMQLGTDMEAMNTFSNLSETEKEKIISYIKGATSGAEARERIASVMNTLSGNHQSFF